MRILLDECVNPRVRVAFPNHEVRTVLDMGWRGASNGQLLALAEATNSMFS
jgi:predicted nuclease of predicted toxin-antitoxin system